MPPISSAPATSTTRDLAAYARLCGLRNDPAGTAAAVALYCRMLAALSAAAGIGYRETLHTLDFDVDAAMAPTDVVATALPASETEWRLAATTPADAHLASGIIRIGSEPGGLHRAIPARADLDSDLGLYGLALGDTACVVRRYADSDVDTYIALTADTNPWLASAPAGIQNSPGRLLPGPLLCGLLGTVLEQHFNGYRLRWLHQRVAFGVPAWCGDDLSATVTITRLQRHNAQAEIAGLIAGTDGRYILTSTTRVHVIPSDAAQSY